MNHETLYSIIFDSIKNEDRELDEVQSMGIFSAPELYVGFLIGKSIKLHDRKIFNNNVEWIRERDLKNGGPTDLVIIDNEEKYAFEIKMGHTIHDYKTDIEKLLRLGESFQKYFIALVDSWYEINSFDPRIMELEMEYENLKRISKFKSFETKQNKYKNKVSCTICVWKVH